MEHDAFDAPQLWKNAGRADDGSASERNLSVFEDDR